MEQATLGLSTELFIALINPAISLVLSLGFVAVYLYRHQVGLLWLAGSYTLGAFGFLVHYFGQPLDDSVARLVANALFVSAGFSLSVGLLSGHDRAVPLVGLTAVSVIGYIAFAWFLFAQPSLLWRIYTVNFTLAAICFLTAAALARLPHQRVVDGMVTWLAVLIGLTFVIRTLAAVAFQPAPASAAAFYTSFYWVTMNFSWSVLSMLIALAVYARAALDAIRDAHDDETDNLTGLLDRRGFERLAAATMAAAPERTSALVLADLDGMTAVNDLYGRAAGDRVIVGFAQKLLKAAGPDALCGRLGGDEFGVLRVDASPEAARAFAEAMRAQFGGSAAPGLPGHVSRVTASFGVASDDGGTYADLQRRCDEAVYEAKRSGRDRVCQARSSAPVWVEPVAWRVSGS